MTILLINALLTKYVVMVHVLSVIIVAARILVLLLLLNIPAIIINAQPQQIHYAHLTLIVLAATVNAVLYLLTAVMESVT